MSDNISMTTMMDSLREDLPLEELDASFLSSASSITCSLMSPNSSQSQASWDKSSCSFSMSQSFSLSSASLLTTEEKQLNSKRWTSRGGGGEGDSALLSPQSLVNRPPQRQSSLYSAFGKRSNPAFESLGSLGSLTEDTADTSNHGSEKMEHQLIRSNSGGQSQQSDDHQQQQWEIDEHNNNKDCIPIMPRRRLDSGQIDEPLNAYSRHSTADYKSPNRSKNSCTVRIADTSTSSIAKELSSLPKTTDDLDMSFNHSIATDMPLLLASWGSSSTPSLFSDEAEVSLQSSSKSPNRYSATPQRSNKSKCNGQIGPKTSDVVGSATLPPPPPPSYSESPSNNSLSKSSTHSTTSVDSVAATASPMYMVGRKVANHQQQQPPPQLQPQRYIPPKTRYLRKHKSDQSRRRRSLVDGTLTSIVEDVDENSDEFRIMSKRTSRSQASS